MGDVVRDEADDEELDDGVDVGAGKKGHDGGRAAARMATSSRRSTSTKARGAAQAKPTRAGRRAKRDLSTVKDGEDEEDDDDEPVEQVNGAVNESEEEEKEEEEVLTPPVSERKGRSPAAVKRNGKEPETIEVDDEGDDEEQIEEDEEEEGDDEDEDEDEIYEMESILKHKITNDGVSLSAADTRRRQLLTRIIGCFQFFFKIKWKGYPDEESTWEPEVSAQWQTRRRKSC